MTYKSTAGLISPLQFAAGWCSLPLGGAVCRWVGQFAAGWDSLPLGWMTERNALHLICRSILPVKYLGSNDTDLYMLGLPCDVFMAADELPTSDLVRRI